MLRIPVIATGVNFTEDSLGQNVYLGADLGNDYVAVTDNFTITNNNRPVLRTVSNDAGNWEFFLPAERSAIAVTYDPVSGLVSTSGGVTNAAGINTFLNRGNFIPSIFPDTDGDGLPDDVEFAIGTNPNNLDTDSDGKNDFAELDSGRNPLDDRPARTGVVSALPTGVTALDVKLAADSRDASRTLAFVASGSSGLTVVDVTDFARPISLAQLGLTGTVNNVSLDVERRRLAASSSTGGVHIIDIADPARPQLLHTIMHEGTDPVAAVELYDGLVYVGVGGKIRVYDMAGGALNLDFALGNQRVEGMSRDGDRLYVTALDIAANQRVLRTIDITATGLTARGSVVLPGVTTTGDPYVVDGVIPSGVVGIPDRFLVAAWIPAGDRLVTVDVSAPANPTIVTANQPIAQGGANDIELNGSGFGVIAGVINPGGTAIVIDAQNPSLVNQQFTRFALPGIGQAVELSGGLAYIAAAGGGLQLVNFLQFDTGFTPPTVQLDPLPGDLDPAPTVCNYRKPPPSPSAIELPTMCRSARWNC